MPPAAILCSVTSAICRGAAAPASADLAASAMLVHVCGARGGRASLQALLSAEPFSAVCRGALGYARMRAFHADLLNRGSTRDQIIMTLPSMLSGGHCKHLRQISLKRTLRGLQRRPAAQPRAAS